MAERGTVFIYEHAGSREELATRVSARLKQGWVVHGEAIEVNEPLPSGGVRLRFSQAVYKHYVEPIRPFLPRRILLSPLG